MSVKVEICRKNKTIHEDEYFLLTNKDEERRDLLIRLLEELTTQFGTLILGENIKLYFT